MNHVLLAIAVLPALVLIGYVYHKDGIEKEPLGLLIKLGVFGGLTVIPAAFLEALGSSVLSAMLYAQGTYYNFVYCFFMIGIVEEGGKYLVMKKIAWRNPEFNYRFDAIVYAVCISLGFAVVENVLYVSQGGVSTGLIRAFTAIPAHAINAVFMGHYFGQAKLCNLYGDYSRESRDLKLAFIVPVFLHGFYDFCAFQGTTFSLIIFIVFVILMDILAIKRVNRSSKDDIEV